MTSLCRIEAFLFHPTVAGGVLDFSPDQLAWITKNQRQRDGEVIAWARIERFDYERSLAWFRIQGCGHQIALYLVRKISVNAFSGVREFGTFYKDAPVGIWAPPFEAQDLRTFFTYPTIEVRE